MDEERLIWTGTPSQVTNLSTFVLCGLTFWLVIPIFIALHSWLKVRFANYELTTERLRVTTGILSRHTEELELYRVKDSSFHQPFLLRIFGLGDIILRTSDRSSPVTVIHAVPDGQTLRDHIRGCVEKQRERKRVRELDV